MSASLQDKNKIVLERDSERQMALTVLSTLMKDSGRWLLCPSEGQSLREQKGPSCGREGNDKTPPTVVSQREKSDRVHSFHPRGRKACFQEHWGNGRDLGLLPI